MTVMREARSEVVHQINLTVVSTQSNEEKAKESFCFFFFFFQAEDGLRDAIDILSIIETLEASNTPAAVAAVNAAGTNAVAQCVYRALWSRLLVIVTRASARSLS